MAPAWRLLYVSQRVTLDLTRPACGRRSGFCSRFSLLAHPRQCRSYCSWAQRGRSPKRLKSRVHEMRNMRACLLAMLPPAGRGVLLFGVGSVPRSVPLRPLWPLSPPNSNQVIMDVSSFFFPRMPRLQRRNLMPCASTYPPFGPVPPFPDLTATFFSPSSPRRPRPPATVG